MRDTETRREGLVARASRPCPAFWRLGGYSRLFSRAGRPCHERTASCIAGVLVMALAGCDVGPEYRPPRVVVLPEYGRRHVEMAATTRSSATTNEPPVVAWWETFHDEKLNVLVRRAMEDNLDLQRAALRIRQARAERAALFGGLFPTINADGSYTHARQSENGVTSAFAGGGAAAGGAPTGGGGGGGGSSAPGANGSPAVPGADISEFNLYQVGLDASWEIDLFGKVRRGVEAANAQVQAAVEDRRDVLVSLLGEVAVNYVELRAAQRRLDIAKTNVAAQSKTRELVYSRYKQGLTNKLDVDRADAEVASVQAQIPSLETRVGQAIHQLSVLVGERPTELVAELNTTAPLPPTPDTVPIGLPSDLLFRRPDLRRAERQLASATAQIGVAEAQLYPSISLTGSIGYQSLEPGTLLDYHSRFYSFGPSVTIPIFQGGKLRAQVKVQEARTQEAVLQFKQAVLNALKDVENALIAYAKNQQRVEYLARAVRGNEQALNVAVDQYKQGITDFLTVLDAQRQLLTSQDNLAQAASDVDTSLVSLYKALGGGWQVSPEEPAIEAAARNARDESK